MVGWVCRGGREGGWTGSYIVSVPPGQVFTISSVCVCVCVCVDEWVGGWEVKAVVSINLELHH